MATGQAKKDLVPTADILLIEHSSDYAALATRAVRDVHPEATIEVLRTSEQALYYLFRAGAYAGRDFNSPRLVLLNVAVPGIGSVEVLERLRRDRVGCSIPVVALALGSHGGLVRQFCTRGASSFITAPIEPDKFMTVIRHIAFYWLSLNLSPSKPD